MPERQELYGVRYLRAVHLKSSSIIACYIVIHGPRINKHLQLIVHASVRTQGAHFRSSPVGAVILSVRVFPSALPLFMPGVCATDDVSPASVPFATLPSDDLQAKTDKQVSEGIVSPNAHIHGKRTEQKRTLQCSHRFVMALRSFIPLVCCCTAAARPAAQTAGRVLTLATTGRAPPHVLASGATEPNIDRESNRVCWKVCCCGTTERPRIEATRDEALAAREKIDMLAMPASRVSIAREIRPILRAASGRALLWFCWL